VTSTQSENTANVGHILTVTRLCTFEVTHGVHITNSVIEQVLTYIFVVYLKKIIKQTYKELIAHIQRCTEAEIYIYFIASLTRIGAVWLKSALFIRVISAATNESQDQWLLQEAVRNSILCFVDRASRYNSGKWPTWRTVLFSYMFISILYMFRSTSYSSSGESTVSIQRLVYVTVCRWPSGMQVRKEISICRGLK
jgi:hypothetical protein